jgi:hypothetical protein
MRRSARFPLLASLILLPMLASADTLSGIVTAVNISGVGPNSAQLEFAVAGPGQPHTLVVSAPPATEPQVFAGMSSFVTSALLAKQRITVTFETVPGQADHATKVEMHATSSTGSGSAKAKGKKK